MTSPTSSFLRSSRPDVDWDGDPDRVDVLLGPFRSRELNPEAHEAKRAFWSGLLRRWMAEALHQAQGRCCFTLAEARAALSVDDGRSPHCLSEVMKTDFLDSGDVRPLAEVRSQLEREAVWKHPGTSLSSKVWSSVKGKVWQQVWPAASSSSEGQEKTPLVFVPALLPWAEARYQALLRENGYRRLRVGQWQLMSAEDLTASAALSPLDATHVDLCLEQWRAQGRLDRRLIRGKTYYKLAATSTTTATATFHDVDEDVLLLRQTADQVSALVDEKALAVDRLTVEVKTLLRQPGQQRVQAKFALRRRKRLEASLEKSLSIQDNLDQLLSRLEATLTEADVLESYRTGLRVLRTQVDKTDADDVQDLMLDIRQCVDAADEMSDALAGATTPADAETAELERELNELMQAQDEKKAKGDQEDDLMRKLGQLKVEDGPIGNEDGANKDRTIAKEKIIMANCL